MKGPDLGVASSVLSEVDHEPQTPPDVQIDNFANEILTASPLDEFERHKDNETLETLRQTAEVIALYFARSLHFKSPWWADEALRRLHAENLPTTKTTKTVHAIAANLRLTGDGQTLTQFQRQNWEDRTFFQVAAMRAAEISVEEAAQHSARWRDKSSDGNATVKASTIETGYPKWASDPLLGKVWVGQLLRVMSKLNDAEKINLIQSNKLRAAMLPPLPEGLKGQRR